MKPPQDRLREWLDAQPDSTQNWLAAELGISIAHLSMLLAGSRLPSLTLAARIEDLARIPARDWIAREVLS